jgi:hypothetical protein
LTSPATTDLKKDKKSIKIAYEDHFFFDSRI